MLRRLLPFLLAMAGVACIVYGYALRRATVLVERPQPAPPAAPDDPTMPSPPDVPAPPLPPAKEPVAVTEGEMVRDATVGGIVRLPDGQLARTYTGSPAQACPT